MTIQYDRAQLIEDLLPVILEAGRAVMEVFESDFSVYEKSDASPVTDADQRGEDIITAALNRLTPDIPVIGEEAKDAGTTPDISGGAFWLVDPLDGTKEFIKRGDDFTVNIGLIEDGRPTLGLVLAPARKRIWAGSVDSGAFAADTDMATLSDRSAIRTRPAPDTLTIVASKSHRSQVLEDWLQHYPGAENISIGSSLKIVLIAEGSADLYPRLGPTCEWDTAAAHAVLRAAGGEAIVADGGPLTYGKDLTTYLNPFFLAKADPGASTPDFPAN